MTRKMLRRLETVHDAITSGKEGDERNAQAKNIKWEVGNMWNNNKILKENDEKKRNASILCVEQLQWIKLI